MIECPKHFLESGDYASWNDWRRNHRNVRVDLRKLDLSGRLLHEIDFSEAHLDCCNLQGARLHGADLRDSVLIQSDLRGASLSGASFQGSELIQSDLSRVEADRADFSEAVFTSSSLAEANLESANLCNADLEWIPMWRANLNNAQMENTRMNYADVSNAVFRAAHIRDSGLTAINFTDADLSGAHIRRSMLYKANLTRCDLRDGIIEGCDLSQATLIATKVDGLVIRECRVNFMRSEVQGEPATQEKLNVASREGPPIHIDDLTCAESVRFFSNNENIVKFIDALNTKGILILGSFKEPYRQTLEAVRSDLLRRDHIPLLFDFPKPKARDWLETIEYLAFLAKGVIADYTNPQQVLCEIPLIARLPVNLPILPIIAQSEEASIRHIEYHREMFPKKILSPFSYESIPHLCSHLDMLLGSLDEASKRH